MCGRSIGNIIESFYSYSVASDPTQLGVIGARIDRLTVGQGLLPPRIFIIITLYVSVYYINYKL